MKVMGKELATVDRLGVQVGKTTMLTDLFEKADVNELYTPVKNVEAIDDNIKETFKIRYNCNDPVLFFGTIGGGLSTFFGIVAAATGEPSGINIAIIGGSALGSLFMSFPWMFKPDKMIDAVNETNAGRLVQWIEERYSLTIPKGEKGKYSDFQEAARGKVKPEGQQFFTKDDKEYLLRKTVDGQLFVEPVVVPTVTASEAKKLEAAKASPDAQDFVGLEPAVAALFDAITSDAMLLGEYNLPVEQQHVVRRAVEEATRAVAILQKMRNLEPDASSVETVDILTLVSVELSAIKKSVMNDLMKELKSVNDYRKHEVIAA